MDNKNNLESVSRNSDLCFENEQKCVQDEGRWGEIVCNFKSN